MTRAGLTTPGPGARALAGSLALLCADLDSLGVAWALVGGWAVTLLTGWMRPCPDIDLAVVAPTQTDRGALVENLSRRGHCGVVAPAGAAG